MIFKGLNAVLSIILSLGLLAGGFTIYQYELGNALECIFGKILAEKLYNNAVLATVGVKSEADYTIPPYTRAGFKDVTAMDGNEGSIIYVYNYEPAGGGVRNVVTFAKSVINNALLLLGSGFGELEEKINEGDTTAVGKLQSLKSWLDKGEWIYGVWFWLESHITGNTETVKGGIAYYIPMKIKTNWYPFDSCTLYSENSYHIKMYQTLDNNERIIKWEIS